MDWAGQWVETDWIKSGTLLVYKNGSWYPIYTITDRVNQLGNEEYIIPQENQEVGKIYRLVVTETHSINNYPYYGINNITLYLLILFLKHFI